MSATSRRTALVVEDDPETSDAIQEELAAAFHVECANSAPAAIARLQRGAPDLLLIDCSLAGDRISELVAHVDRTRTGMVLLSCTPELVPHLFALVGCAALHKPLASDRLWAAIDNALQGRIPGAQQGRHREALASA